MTRTLSVLTLLLAVTACHVPQHRMTIFAHTAQPPPAAAEQAGRSIGVLPPFTVGSEHALAAQWLEALETLVAAPLAGTPFVTPSLITERYARDVEAFNVLHETLTAGLPTDFGPEGDSVQIHASHWKDEEHTEPDRVVLLQEALDATPLGPAHLDPALLAAAGTDDVLVTIPYTYHVTESHVLAMFGVLPIMGSSHIRHRTPRGAFLLYDAATGEKRWEARVAASTRPPIRKDYPGIPAASEPLVGALYLLTGEVEEPLRRLSGNIDP